MVNLGGTQKVGVHASDAMTSDGKSGRYQKTRLFGHLLWWCWVGSKFLGNDILFMQAMTSDGKSGRYREKPIDSAQVRGPTTCGTCMYPRPWAAPCGPTGCRTQRVTGFMQELTSDGNSGGTQKVDFLGTCFGGAGLGPNSWAMISRFTIGRHRLREPRDAEPFSP